MLMSGNFYVTLRRAGDTGHCNRTSLQIGGYIFPYQLWRLCGHEFYAGDHFYLRIPSGYMEGKVNCVEWEEDVVILDVQGMWRGRYNGLAGGKCAYGTFSLYPGTGVVYESNFFPRDYHWEIPLELYQLLSAVAREQNWRPSGPLEMEEFVNLCFSAGIYYARERLDRSAGELKETIDRLLQGRTGIPQ